MVNLLLLERFGFTVPFMDGLTGSRMVKYFQEIMENPEGALEGE